jgi:hypothetical protein
MQPLWRNGHLKKKKMLSLEVSSASVALLHVYLSFKTSRVVGALKYNNKNFSNHHYIF